MVRQFCPCVTAVELPKQSEANSYCFIVSCVPEGMFSYLE